MISYSTSEDVNRGGVYQCFAASNDMIFTGNSPHILVLFAPFFTVHPESVNTSFNSSVEFRCTAVGHPSPMVQWYRLHSNVNISDLESVNSLSVLFPYSSFFETESTNTSDSSLLIIDSLEYDDFGYYVCVASLDNSTVIYVRDCCSPDSDNDLSPSQEETYTFSNFAVLAGEQVLLYIKSYYVILAHQTSKIYC